MARITLPDGDNPEIVRALSLRPDFAQAVGGFEKAVWGSSLDWRLHELVRMQVAMINECTVCLGWRTPQAIEAGVTDELLAGVASYRTFPDFTEAERVALEYTQHFCTDSARISDDLMNRLGEQFAAGEIVELTLVIGKYLSMGRFMQVLGLDQSCSLAFDDDSGRVVAS
jgi:AhpD family alkylhydroperoxidase